ncbi:MAG: phospholipase D-like domain-containing protein [Fuerstiella sp.]
MDHSSIERMLRSSLQDGKVSRSEKKVLRSLLALDAEESHERDWIRNRAFLTARESLSGPDSKKAVEWLEDVMGLLVSAERPGTQRSTENIAEVHFSPGNDCRYRIQELLDKATTNIDICVFTITDDRVTDAIIDAHSRGVRVRVISDNDKAHDRGSDLSRLERLGPLVAYDQTPDHMHHKFAIFDGKLVVSGSYNWTRSAAERNEENIVVSGDLRLVSAFQRRFDQLWKQLA